HRNRISNQQNVWLWRTRCKFSRKLGKKITGTRAKNLYFCIRVFLAKSLHRHRRIGFRLGCIEHQCVRLSNRDRQSQQRRNSASSREHLFHGIYSSDIRSLRAAYSAPPEWLCCMLTEILQMLSYREARSFLFISHLSNISVQLRFEIEHAASNGLSVILRNVRETKCPSDSFILRKGIVHKVRLPHLLEH